jgi:hypothetical protein
MPVQFHDRLTNALPSSEPRQRQSADVSSLNEVAPTSSSSSSTGLVGEAIAGHDHVRDHGHTHDGAEVRRLPYASVLPKEM